MAARAAVTEMDAAGKVTPAYGTTARCLAEYLVELYNKRRTKNVLPSWRDS